MGQTDNNIKDYEYDLKDPAKQHFALIKGEISLGTAKTVNIVLLMLTFFGGVILAAGNFTLQFPVTPHWTPLIFLFVSMGSGLLYNRLCKKTVTAPLFITAAFTSIPLFTYFCITQELNFSISMVAVYTVFLMSFQIMFEGFLKDFESDPVNLLRKWGATLDDEFVPGTLRLGKQLIFWVFLKMTNLAIGFWLCWFTSGMIALVLYILLWAAAVPVLAKLFSPDYSNKAVVKNASRMEILTYMMLIVALQGLLGWTIVAILVIYPIVWFACLNYLTWKTVLMPKV